METLRKSFDRIRQLALMGNDEGSACRTQRCGAAQVCRDDAGQLSHGPGAGHRVETPFCT